MTSQNAKRFVEKLDFLTTPGYLTGPGAREQVGLPENTGGARRGVYEKARKAIVRQLEGFDPPLSPSEITRQRLSLEECIRRVEAEAGADGDD